MYLERFLEWKHRQSQIDRLFFAELFEFKVDTD